ncbi:MAG: MerR family transcriptional regulator [Clostridia bacterium]|nr:MerR family transcriptional regulator [Clostridia bacterium]
MKRYKIGEVARLLGTTTQALRFYEQEGIIVPEKTENGTRTYSEADIIRLMAFKRYQLLEFSVQDVAEYFKKGSIPSLLDTIGEHRNALLRKSEELLRRAHAMEHYEMLLRTAGENIDRVILTRRPDVYMHPCSLAELEMLKGSKKESFERFMEAMPDAHICFAYHPDGEKPLRFYFAVTEPAAQTWSLPLEDAVCHKGGKCVVLFVRTDMQLWQEEYLQAQLARVEAEGYKVDRSVPVLGQQLASENVTAAKNGYLLAALHISVL